MRNALNWCRRGLVAGAAVGALGFGTAQAFAGPAPAGTAENTCDKVHCRSTCIAGGATSGICVYDPSYGYYCECVYDT